VDYKHLAWIWRSVIGHGLAGVYGDAHTAGASYGLLGRVVGLSRQRVARIIAG
jgi:hypothetical protein